MSTTFASSCSVAFKEWAVICESLATGRQTVILRKGGIHEGRDGFRIDHSQFWLYPTNFHQAADGLCDAAAPWLDAAKKNQPTEGVVRINLFATVHEVIEVHDEERALSLSQHHIWSDATVRQRFRYKQPGLFLLVVRVYHRLAPVELTESPYFAGCRSWVDLAEPLSTADLRPVLDDAGFELRTRELHN